MLELNLAVVESLMPDRTILLELGVADAAGRMGGDLDRIEREDDGFRAPRRRRLPASSRRMFPERYVHRRRHRARRSEIAEEIHGALAGR